LWIDNGIRRAACLFGGSAIVMITKRELGVGIQLIHHALFQVIYK